MPNADVGGDAIFYHRVSPCNNLGTNRKQAKSALVVVLSRTNMKMKILTLNLIGVPVVVVAEDANPATIYITVVKKHR